MSVGLITEDYRKLNQELHARNETYGTSGHKYAHMVRGLAAAMGVTEMLDYGCGKQTLANALPQFVVKGYDPAFPALSKRPDPSRLVICTDVMEHIEPECLDNVLADLQQLTLDTVFFQIACREAKKTLQDGRNAHLIVKSGSWWFSTIEKFFTVLQYQCVGDQCLIVAKSIGDSDASTN